MSLLAAEDLHVTYPGGDRAVRGVDLRIEPGERVGLLGESGCGKTTLGRALVGLLPAGTDVTGRVRLGDRELTGDRGQGFQRVRGRQIALVPQGAMGALNPVLRIDEQVGESLVAHTGRSWRAARREVPGLLEQVGLEASVARRYPHELSGGMCQRVVIAAAIAAEPDLVIADEPTTGLDVVVQGQVLATLTRLQRQRGFALLLVSHDVRTVLRVCDRVVVMYAGRVAEDAGSERLRATPRHPYTAGLLRSLPPLATSANPDAGWASIPGSAPAASDPIQGCAFAPRCPHRMATCEEVDPAVTSIDAAETAAVSVDEPGPRGGQGLPVHGAHGHRVACHLLDQGPDTDADEADGVAADFPVLARRRRAIRADHDLLVVTDLALTYPGRHRRSPPVRALRGVSFDVAPGRIVGLIGQSGSGKSTVARVLVGLAHPQRGSARMAGMEIVGARGKELLAHRGRVAMVRQDPFDALHPAMTIRDIVAEPRIIAGMARTDSHVGDALRLAQLVPTPTLLGSRPGQLSGGQRQRVALARALAGEPRLLIADEPTSMLDTSVRAGIARTLLDLRDELGLGVLFITHDLAEAAHVCDQVVVLLDGEVVEHGVADQVTATPRHPYTRTLLAAADDPLAGAPDSTATDPHLEHTR